MVELEFCGGGGGGDGRCSNCSGGSNGHKFLISTVDIGVFPRMQDE